jgi:hypothetical protein
MLEGAIFQCRTSSSLALLHYSPLLLHFLDQVDQHKRRDDNVVAAICLHEKLSAIIADPHTASPSETNAHIFTSYHYSIRDTCFDKHLQFSYLT